MSFSITVRGSGIIGRLDVQGLLVGETLSEYDYDKLHFLHRSKFHAGSPMPAKVCIWSVPEVCIVVISFCVNESHLNCIYIVDLKI